jgi:hypothetical protein
MKKKEQNSQDANVPYQCNFIILPKKEKGGGSVDDSSKKLPEDYFSPEEKFKN